MLRTCKDITPNTKNMLHTYKNSTCKDIISMIRNMLHTQKNVTYKNIIPQHQKYVTYIQRYKLSTPKICYAYTQIQTFNLRIVLNILKKSLIYHFAC